MGKDTEVYWLALMGDEAEALLEQLRSRVVLAISGHDEQMKTLEARLKRALDK